MHVLLLSLFAGIFLMGAQCVPGSVELPYEQQTPDITIDLASQVASFESSVANSGDENRAILAALCATEAGRSCNPPTLPSSIPRQIDDPRAGFEGQSLDVAAWISALPALDGLQDISHAISFDAGEELGVSTPEQVQSVIVKSIVVQFSENTLTYPLPPVVLYAGSGVAQDALDDVDALIQQGQVAHFGDLAEIPAGDTIAHAMALDNAGKVAFSDALKALKVSLALRSMLTFPPNGTGPIPKPDGVGVLSATIKATFVVNTEADSLF